jgi:hypothetical protein
MSSVIEIGELLSFINLMAPESNMEAKDIDQTTTDFLEKKESIVGTFQGIFTYRTITPSSDQEVFRRDPAVFDDD